MTRIARIIAVLLACLMADVAAAGEVSRTVEIDAATLIAFAPPLTREADDEGSVEALAHLQFAVEDTRKCALPRKIAVTLVHADVIVLRNGATSESVPVHAMGQAIGGILVEPGKAPRVVVSQDGPSTLQELLPAAAATYWHAEGCRR